MPPHSPWLRPYSARIFPAKIEMKKVCPKLLRKASKAPAESQRALLRRKVSVVIPLVSPETGGKESGTVLKSGEKMK